MSASEHLDRTRTYSAIRKIPTLPKVVVSERHVDFGGTINVNKILEIACPVWIAKFVLVVWRPYCIRDKNPLDPVFLLTDLHR